MRPEISTDKYQWGHMAMISHNNNKNAFQSDAYWPRIDRIPVLPVSWGGGGGVVGGGGPLSRGMCSSVRGGGGVVFYL